MLAAILLAGLMTVAAGGLHIGAAVVARHRAQAAADLAALAGAAALPAGVGAACRQAGAVSTAMGTLLSGCDALRLDVVVSVIVPTRSWNGGQARAYARAGPVQAG